MAGMSYSALLIDHYEHPRHAGVFEDGLPGVASATVGTPAFGGVVQLQIAVDTGTGVIREARFKAYGSAPTIACASLASEALAGKTLQQALAIGHGALAQALELPPMKLHCAILIEEAIRSVVDDYQARHGAAVSAA